MTFKINENKGFSISLKNGLTVSVQFGRGNYCDNRDIDTNPGQPVPESERAEVAIYETDGGEWVRMPEGAAKSILGYAQSDDVIGWVKADEVVKILSWAAYQEPRKPRETAEWPASVVMEKADDLI